MVMPSLFFDNMRYVGSNDAIKKNSKTLSASEGAKCLDFLKMFILNIK
jgi:hypothetical protein